PSRCSTGAIAPGSRPASATCVDCVDERWTARTARTSLAAMSSAPFRLTDRARAAGCAGKMGPADLAKILAGLPPVSHPDPLVGSATCDDAGGFRLTPALALRQPSDFLAPL